MDWFRQKVSKRTTSVLLLTGVTLLSWSCSDEQTNPTVPSDPVPSSTVTATGPNLLFLVLDAARARNFQGWGYHRNTTPHMDALAEEGVYFRNTFAQSTSTPNSIESYFSGRFFPLWRKGYARDRYTGSENDLPRAFLDAGYQTAGFSDNPFVTDDFGFDSGFQHFEDFVERWSASYSGGTGEDSESEKMLAAILGWTKENSGQPWFVYAHILRPHGPYISPEPYGKRFATGYDTAVDGSTSSLLATMFSATPEETAHLQALYDGNLAYVDAYVNTIIEGLKEQGLYDDTWIVITSDHGEAFMEHGKLLHNGHAFDEEIHVPLIIKPTKDFSSRTGRIDDLVALVDLFPTFIEVFHLKGPDKLDGLSLVNLVQGIGSWDRGHVFAYRPTLRDVTMRSATTKFMAVFHDSFSFDQMQPLGYFDLARDPLERVKIERTNSELKLYHGLITNWIGSLDSAPTLNEAEVEADRIEQLKAIGYLL